MNLSEIGRIANNYWNEIPTHFPYTKLDEFIIMPNHLHGIIKINNGNDPRRDAIYRVSPITKNVSHIKKIDSRIEKIDSRIEKIDSRIEKTRPAIIKIPPQKGGITGINNPMLNKSISKIIRWYKGRCTFEIKKIYSNSHFSWQPRFYDSIIRSEQDLLRIRMYIQNNSVKYSVE